MDPVVMTWKQDQHTSDVGRLMRELLPDASIDERFSASLELGVVDGDTFEFDQAGEVILITPRAQILRNIEAARNRGDRTIAQLVEAGEIKAELFPV